MKRCEPVFLTACEEIWTGYITRLKTFPDCSFNLRFLFNFSQRESVQFPLLAKSTLANYFYIISDCANFFYVYDLFLFLLLFFLSHTERVLPSFSNLFEVTNIDMKRCFLGSPIRGAPRIRHCKDWKAPNSADITVFWWIFHPIGVCPQFRGWKYYTKVHVMFIML